MQRFVLFLALRELGSMLCLESFDDLFVRPGRLRKRRSGAAFGVLRQPLEGIHSSLGGLRLDAGGVAFALHLLELRQRRDVSLVRLLEIGLQARPLIVQLLEPRTGALGGLVDVFQLTVRRPQRDRLNLFVRRLIDTVFGGSHRCSWGRSNRSRATCPRSGVPGSYVTRSAAIQRSYAG